MGLLDWFGKRPTKSVDELLTEARLLVSAGKHREAVPIFMRIRKRDRSTATLVELASAQIEAGDHFGAAATASSALDMDAKCADAKCIQAEIQRRDKHFSEARRLLKEALEFDPHSARALAAMKASDSKLASSECSLISYSGRDCASVVGATRWPVPALSTYSTDPLRLQIGSDANAMITSALELHDSGMARFRKGECLAANAFLQAAQDRIRSVYRGDHELVALIVNNRACCMNALGDAAGALPLYRQALEMRERLYPATDHPDVAGSLNNVAGCMKGDRKSVG